MKAIFVSSTTIVLIIGYFYVYRYHYSVAFTNIKGTQNLLEVVREFEVERFPLVSTDKAVQPSNVKESVLVSRLHY